MPPSRRDAVDTHRIRPQLQRRASDEEIAALAERQHGVVAHPQLVAIGYSSQGIHRRIASGRLHPMHRGVYAVGHRKLTPEGHWMATVLAIGPDAVLSHLDAAEIHNLRRSSPTKFHVTVPRLGVRSRAKIRVHCTATLHPDDITVVDGIPVTTVARTLIDLAVLLRLHAIVRVIEQAERLELLNLRAIDATLARADGRRGVKRLRKALAAYRPPPTTKSGSERKLLRALHAAGLPPPHVNTMVAGHEVDLHWPRARLVVEVDGRRYHDSPRAFETDRIKDAALQRAGQAVLRITEERMERDLDGTIADVIALARRRATGASP